MDESPLLFVESWTAELRSLQSEIDAKSSATSDLSPRLQRLSDELTARAVNIPNSELRRCERELKAAQETLSAQAAPKSKFSFKRSTPSSRSVISAPPVTAPAPSSTSPTSSAAPEPSSIPPTPLIITSRSDSYLSSTDLPARPASSAAEALALTSLLRCFVHLASTANGATLADRFSTLYLSDIADSVVVLPVINGGSVMVQNCRRCVLALGGHQFRMHDSTECLVLLAASSTPIIERCKGLVLGTYSRSLRSPSPVHSSIFAVQDFDDPFATPERPSPNWRQASEAEEMRIEPFLRAGQAGWKQTRDGALRVVDGLSEVAKQ
ncbi:tubulin folding cofactor C [Rhodotorula toruloides]|uniref:Tubulin folding cofactor C n=1 Tax=Rhodotorula toruloides TaxID=5286 RepID=A0A511KFX1_RHOTO|nr:tubulin folding cofactor C [Rhodotorula toruloides]